ncbi:MAG: hypothetical protein AAB758_01015, partial [Patescibacteria group bacterium]
MRRYLATLHKRSDEHKKRFALLVSGGISLFIFAIWSMATFGPTGSIAESNTEPQRAHEEVGPIESIRVNLASSLESLKNNIQELISGA